MDKLWVVISIDVEEEGLFSGEYVRKPRPPASVAHLSRLEFITRDLGLPLSLLCTYPVITDPTCQKALLAWRERWGAELGAHLHPWNTPPFGPVDQPEPHLAQDIAPEVMEAKLASLLDTLRDSLGEPARSFRMGRFDLTPELAACLPARGIRVDSSLVPLRTTAHGPDHFAAPIRPHWIVEPAPDQAGLCEAPLTMAAIVPGSRQVVSALAALLGTRLGRRLKKSFRYFGVVGVQPTMHSLSAMRLATRLHVRREGRILVMFLHSSELMPGATKAYGNEEAVQGLVNKLASFLGWLKEHYQVQGLRLSQIADHPAMNQPN